jgi:hypothetical protein
MRKVIYLESYPFTMKDITEISYSRDANKHFITGVYITIND